MGRGRPKDISDKELLKTVEEIEYPVVTAKHLSESVALTRQAVHKRLSKLHNEDKLNRAKLGERVVIWWRPRD